MGKSRLIITFYPTDIHVVALGNFRDRNPASYFLIYMVTVMHFFCC